MAILIRAGDLPLNFPADPILGGYFSLVAPATTGVSSVVKVRIEGATIELPGVSASARWSVRPPTETEMLKIFGLRSVIENGQRTYFWTQIDMRQPVGEISLPNGIEVSMGGAGVRLIDILGAPLRTLLASAPLAVEGSRGNDTITLPDGFDGRAQGGAGADLLTGGTGNDALYGGVLSIGQGSPGESDTLYGGNGNDLLFGGNGDDFVFWRQGQRPDRRRNGGRALCRRPGRRPVPD
jgi:hypothetical protein